eukprot:4162150-Pleurochrysis_carterae.AAC.1
MAAGTACPPAALPREGCGASCATQNVPVIHLTSGKTDSSNLASLKRTIVSRLMSNRYDEVAAAALVDPEVTGCAAEQRAKLVNVRLGTSPNLAGHIVRNSSSAPSNKLGRCGWT